MKTLPPVHRIALLFNGSKIYDRGIITGIGNYLSSTRASWDLFLEEDFLCRLKGIERWQGDGIIADFDDPLIGEALADIKLPVVAVGGSYEDARAYPRGIPYVATDNHALMKLAYEHLIEAGLTPVACFSLPPAQANRWAQEREKAFKRLLQRDGLPVEVYRGLGTSAPLWDSAVEQQIAWLQSLPKPIGIIAVTDARARQLLQALPHCRYRRAGGGGVDRHRQRPADPHPHAGAAEFGDPGHEVAMGRTARAAASDAARQTLHRHADPGATGCNQCAGFQLASAVGQSVCDAGAAVHPPVRLPGHQDRPGRGVCRCIAFIPGIALSQDTRVQRA